MKKNEGKYITLTLVKHDVTGLSKLVNYKITERKSFFLKCVKVSLFYRITDLIILIPVVLLTVTQAVDSTVSLFQKITIILIFLNTLQ